MPDFEFADDSPSPARRSHPAPGPSWLSLFTAVLAANLIAAVVLFVSVRAYVKWSVEDSLEKVRNPPAARVK